MRRVAVVAAVLLSACSETRAAPDIAQPATTAATTASTPSNATASAASPPSSPLSAAASASVGVGVSASASADAAAAPDDSRKNTVVLHIGDSFTEAWLEQNLRARFRGVGAKYLVKSKNASYTPTWAYGGELDTMLWQKPALVLITLGANEMDMPAPELHAAAVREIAKKASKTGTCVWITPPRWKKDSGFLGVIKENCAPCVFWDSDEHVQDIERQRDKIHPNEAGGARWAAAFWGWLEDHREPGKGWALRQL